MKAKPKKPADVRFISKAAAIETIRQMQNHNAVMAMILSVLMRRYGAHILSRTEAVGSEPEKLHISREGDVLMCWWGDTEPKTPLQLVEDDGSS